MRNLLRVGLPTVAIVAAALSWPGTTPAAETQERPGEGVFCALAIYSVINQVGTICHPGQDPELQLAMKDSVARLSKYVLDNHGGSPADVQRFLKDQGGVGAPKTRLCQGDAAMMYEAFRKAGAGPVRQSVDQATARPGKPTWGTCL